MTSTLWTAPCLLLLCTGCSDEAQWDSDTSSRDTAPTVTRFQQLRTTREAGALPPSVYASLELSDAAVTRFLSLGLTVSVYSGESLDGEGLRAQWLGAPGGDPVRANFGGEWSAMWSAYFSLDSNPCAAAPCVLNLELTPEGEWSSELGFPMEYEVIAGLVVRGVHDSMLDDALELTLEASP